MRFVGTGFWAHVRDLSWNQPAGVNWNSLDRDAHGSYFAKGVVEKGLFCHYAGWVQTTSDPTRSDLISQKRL